jgi:hypothetical protein
MQIVSINLDMSNCQIQGSFRVADACSFNLTINVTGSTDLKVQIVSSITGDNSSVSIAQFNNVKTTDITIGSSFSSTLSSSVVITPTSSTGTSQVFFLKYFLLC